MALRDEILKQKEQKAEEERLAKIERQKLDEIKALEEKQKAEEERNKKYEEYFDLKSQVEAGNAPQEWLDIYERLIEKAKNALLEGREDFEIKEASTQKYYEKKLNNGVGENCELNLMNKYLTERLIADGFKEASFKLEKVPEYYATDADYAEQKRLQAQYDRAAEEANERARTKWMYDSFDGVDQPVPSYIYPKLASLSKSGVKYRYEIIAKGSLHEKKQKDRSANSTKPSKLFKVLTILLTAIGIVWGALYYINFQLVIAPIACGVGGWLVGLALSGIRVNVLHVPTYSYDKNLTSSDRGKKIFFNIVMLIVWVAIIVGVIFALNYFFPIQNIIPTE